MKIRFTLLLISLFCSFNTIAQDKYYWSCKKKILLTKDSLENIVYTKDEQSLEKFKNKINSLNANSREIAIGKKNALIITNKKSETALLSDDNQQLVSYVMPVYKIKERKVYFINEILFKLKSEVKIKDLLRYTGNNIIKATKYDTYIMEVNADYDVFDLANLIYESNLVDWCHPNFKADIVKSEIPVDPLFSNQYYLRNTGQFSGLAGMDINVTPAWDITKGGNLRVVVIDDGLENHEDMNGRILPGFTPINNGNGSPVSDCFNDFRVGHGMACAGIIGASHNTIGISGIAPNVNLIPVNIFAGGETANDVAEGINWAWDPSGGNADIISNSWRDLNYSDAYVQAITNARTLGRNRNGSTLGAIVVFASGNDNESYSGVTFPANVPGVITVGAIDNSGNIHNYSSRGSEMDLVAPSGGSSGLQNFLGCLISIGNLTTTDRMGNSGYNSSNYLSTFSGTSAACPQVSGVAALMLSVNPNLTEVQVRTILQQTAVNMGSPGFDNTFGYGRVSALRAVEAALPIISGPSEFCTSGTYSIPNLPAGATVNWSIVNSIAWNPGYILSVAPGGSTQNPVTVNGDHSRGTLTAIVSHSGGSFKLTKPIAAGPVPVTPIIANGRLGTSPNPRIVNFNVCPGSILLSFPGVQNLQASLIFGGPIGPQVYGTNIHWDFPMYNYYSTISMRVEYDLPCGHIVQTINFNKNCNSNYIYSIYPNPTDSELTINSEDQISKTEASTENISTQKFRAELINNFGEKIRVGDNLGGKNIVLDTRNIPSGTYFLHITDENQVIKKQIIINHNR